MFNGSGCLTTTTTIASMNNHHYSNSLSSAATTATSSTTSLFLGKPTTLPTQPTPTVAPHFGQPPQLNPIISTQATQMALQQGQTSMAQLWQLQQQQHIQQQQQQQSLTDKYLIFMV